MSRAPKVEKSAERAKPWVDKAARVGYVAKGAVYILVGALAARAAWGGGGSARGRGGALREVAAQPFGQVLLAVVVAGLVGYTLWRFVQAALDTEDEGAGLRGVLFRAGFALSGLIYAAWTYIALRVLLPGRSGPQNPQEDWTARLMAQPFGPWLVGAFGLLVVVVGLYQAYRAYQADFRDSLKLSKKATRETWVTTAGRVGFTAKAVVYALIGIFLVQAALRHDPERAGGLGEALQTVASGSYGPFLLGLLALGLAAFGVFSLLLARYRALFGSAD